MPEPKYLVPYAGMIPIRFNGSRHLAISAPNESIQIQFWTNSGHPDKLARL